MITETDRKVERALLKLKKDFGEDTILRFDEAKEKKKISSGSLTLDFAIGGGIPAGRITELSGEPGVGKSTLAMEIVSNTLSKDTERYALYLDTEQRQSSNWMEQHIEAIDRVILVQPDNIEDAARIAMRMLEDNLISIIVLDSVAGAASEQELERDLSTAIVGGNNAKSLGRMTRALMPYINKKDVVFLGINQTRADLSGYSRLITPGGQAWKFACSLRIELKRRTKEIEETEHNGQTVVSAYKTWAKIHKNSEGPAGNITGYWTRLIPDSKGKLGINQELEILDLSFALNIIEKLNNVAYGHSLFPNGKIIGRDNVIKFLQDNDEAREQIKRDLFKKLETDFSQVSEKFEVTTDMEVE
jgi:recombination protein RecA